MRTVAAVASPPLTTVPKLTEIPVAMALNPEVSTRKQVSKQREVLSLIKSSALEAFASIRFSTEDAELYPPLCKQHLWQQILRLAVARAANLIQDSPTFKLMHGLVPYTPMESFAFHMDAAYKSTQFSKEELTFLRKLRLEQFLCNVPWGVVHPARAAEAINTLQEDTLQVTLKGEVLPLFSENWRDLFFKIFHLTPKGVDEGEKLQLHELFPSLETIQEGQSSVKVGDCQAAGSRRPLRLLSSFFCLNTSSQYSVTIHFAKLVLAALNGEKVDWPLEFFDEFKAEVITLHRHQQEDKAKVIRTVVGPHLTLLIDEANFLGSQEKKTAGFGTAAGLTMSERAPPPRKRKLTEASGSGKLHTVVRVTPHPSKLSNPNTPSDQAADTGRELPKRRVIQTAEKWEVPDDTSIMVNQICFTHRRLEQLLTTFTKKAGSEFIKTMDSEFQKITQEATHQFNQGLKEKEALTENEHAVEKGLLHIEIRKLTKELATLNEGYAEQIEMVFQLQDQLTTAETTFATLTDAHRTQQIKFDQVTEDLAKQNHKLAVTEAELEATQQRLTALQVEHDEQTTTLVSLEEELRQCLKTSFNTTSPVTPRSGDTTPQLSDSMTHTGTSGLYSMIEEMMDPTEFQQRSIAELQQELQYITRERDELKLTIERTMEGPLVLSAEPLNSAEIPRSAASPKDIIYKQFTTNIPPLTTVMQYFHALKGLHLLMAQVPILKAGVTLSKPQFEQIWAMADATARDTLAFMWVKSEFRLPIGVMEVVVGSPPFYVGRFVLRALSFISHHHSIYYNHTPLNRLPTLKPYPHSIFNQVRDSVRNQHITFNQALKTLTTEDTTICYEAVQQFTWLRERHPHRLPGPYTIPQIKDYVIRVIKEKETAISTRRFGTPNSRTILQPEQ